MGAAHAADPRPGLAERREHGGRAPAWGDWLATWLPGWQDLLRLGIGLTQAALAWVGSAAPWIVWTVWGLGCAALLGIAGLLSLLLKLALPKPAPAPAGTA
ncbi:hypothetical protein [Methylibium sp. T29]|uniref:hypothetical protein n=1 Tax=Methylibium sp. T29 TaxID=1430884 RepID=UPI001268D7E8|nr:hypothetical protein [Methylibium sp. T29]